MEMIIDLLLLVVAYMGFIIGIVLSLISPEEMKPGRYYFLNIRKILFLVILILPFLQKNTFVMVSELNLILLYLIYYFICRKRFEKKKFVETSARYVVFTLMYLFIIPEQMRLIFLVVMFLYGLPEGSLLEKKEKNIVYLLRVFCAPIILALLSIIVKTIF